MNHESRGPKVNGYKQAGRLEREARRRERSQHRQAERDSRSAVEQLEVLASRPGQSRKESARLSATIAVQEES